MDRVVVQVPICVGRFFVDCGFSGVRSGFGQGIYEGASICSWEFYGEVDVWICETEVVLKFVDLIFPGGTVDIINIPEPPFNLCLRCRNG